MSLVAKLFDSQIRHFGRYGEPVGNYKIFSKSSLSRIPCISSSGYGQFERDVLDGKPWFVGAGYCLMGPHENQFVDGKFVWGSEKRPGLDNCLAAHYWFDYVKKLLEINNDGIFVIWLPSLEYKLGHIDEFRRYEEHFSLKKARDVVDTLCERYQKFLDETRKEYGIPKEFVKIWKTPGNSEYVQFLKDKNLKSVFDKLEPYGHPSTKPAYVQNTGFFAQVVYPDVKYPERAHLELISMADAKWYVPIVEKASPKLSTAPHTAASLHYVEPYVLTLREGQRMFNGYYPFVPRGVGFDNFAGKPEQVNLLESKEQILEILKSAETHSLRKCSILRILLLIPSIEERIGKICDMCRNKKSCESCVELLFEYILKERRKIQ